VDVVPVDVQLRIVAVPVHVRDVAVRITRARILSVSIRITDALFCKNICVVPALCELCLWPAL
jgi:hypothetical protein